MWKWQNSSRWSLASSTATISLHMQMDLPQIRLGTPCRTRKLFRFWTEYAEMSSLSIPRFWNPSTQNCLLQSRLQTRSLTKFSQALSMSDLTSTQTCEPSREILGAKRVRSQWCWSIKTSSCCPWLIKSSLSWCNHKDMVRCLICTCVMIQVF